MPATVRDLVGERQLGLRVRAGEDALDRPVTWVHVSELTDPTPFLEGGELLLTTGLTMSGGSDLAGFVRRFVDSGGAALGFGTGLSHQEVPEGLVEAAEAAGLPLVEVPRPTPFIAISKSVSAALAADAYAEVTTTNSARQELTKAALATSGRAGVVRRLARLLDGWVLLLDSTGEVLHAAPSAASRRVAEVSGEVDRLRARRGPASSSFSLGAEQVSAQTLGDRSRAYLVVGRSRPLGRTDQHVLSSAAALLTLVVAGSQDHGDTLWHLRTALMRLILAGRPEAARETAAQVFGPLPEEPVRVVALAGEPAALRAAVELLAAPPRGTRWFVAEVDGYVLVVTPAETGDHERIPGRVGDLHLGVSEPAGYAAAEQAHRQAVRAAGAARRTGAGVLRFSELARQGLLGLVPRAEAEAFAESLLAPVLRHDGTGRGDLLGSLREWLRQHGQWDPAAARLGVHRHTLRNRIGKVAELTGADLDSPDTRAELWLALQQLDPG
ncbi:PucR family transcriptional regulator [Haloechinothrix sp. YIM 98757]|uniref:PucR family transcriptional regulator n=1 Tax=Haloechinothrix aidingensis TaxID=2752311 RepID=A0A838ABI5_9PSEU|nr:PucR family transcriptional regulator [Haloechinothrix aidingensis]MBA0126597.1 PucR family transcriptional regulator [Haloechinothrix aidingensis]